MSTTPSDAWRDAGLEAPEETTSLTEEVTSPRPAAGQEDHVPGSPRPDLDGSADEADVAEQAAAVPDDPDDPGAG
ncbi:hypothetical protein ACNHYB_06425 [Isoptericola jiangsuensis]|uniref:hypothetical protein n=1 Tax=Isoptericola jiangsuensis TaxID=548579 RepID=UPI003AABB709